LYIPKSGLDWIAKNTDDVSEPEVYNDMLAVSAELEFLYFTVNVKLPVILPDAPEKVVAPEDDSWYDPVVVLSQAAVISDFPPYSEDVGAAVPV
jgi:hypothetical protein